MTELLFECPTCKGWHFNITVGGRLICASVSKYTDYKVKEGGCGWIGWQASAERKDAEIKALRGFALSLAKVAQTTLPGNYVYIALREHNLIDETGQPTALLTGESE